MMIFTDKNLERKKYKLEFSIHTDERTIEKLVYVLETYLDTIFPEGCSFILTESDSNKKIKESEHII